MTRMQIMGDNGEWHDVTGVKSIEIHEEPIPDAEQPWRALAEHIARAKAERDRIFLDLFRYVAAAYTRAAAEASQQLAEMVANAQKAARAAGVVDEQGKPVKRSDRPAWQSPYGPPRRR